MVEHKLVAENERLRRENAELRERVELLARMLDPEDPMHMVGIFPARKVGRLERLAARFRRTPAGD